MVLFLILCRKNLAHTCPPATSPTVRFRTPYRLKLLGLKSVLVGARLRMFAGFFEVRLPVVAFWAISVQAQQMYTRPPSDVCQRSARQLVPLRVTFP